MTINDVQVSADRERISIGSKLVVSRETFLDNYHRWQHMTVEEIEKDVYERIAMAESNDEPQV